VHKKVILEKTTGTANDPSDICGAIGFFYICLDTLVIFYMRMRFMRYWIISSILLMIVSPGFAGGENYPLGARSAAMGNASVTLSDVWSVHHNQAGLSGIKQPVAGIHYENRFGMKELSLKAAVFAFPLPGEGGNVLGLSMVSFGYSSYNDTKFGLSFGKILGDKYAIGLQLDYLQTSIAGDYGRKGVLAAEVGLQAEILDDLSIGVHIFNPTRTKILEYEIQEKTEIERIPTIMRFGIKYAFSDKVFVTLETEKDVYFKPIFKGGIEYHPIDLLYLRGGLSSDPVYNSFGFGLDLNNFKLDFSASKHQVLGYTTQISFLYNFEKRKPRIAE